MPCLPHGHWPSPLSPASLFQGGESLHWPQPAPSGFFFLLSRPEENNDLALMHLAPGGELTRISPPGVSVRSRIHEYGVLPYAYCAGAVYYCRDADQRVLRQPFDPLSLRSGEPRPLTPDLPGRVLRYGDFEVDARRRRLLCVREDHRGGGLPLNTLVSLDLDRGGEGEPLFTGADFVASPRLAPDGSRLALLAWSLPDMPWDDSDIHLAELAGDGQPRHWRRVAKPAPAALAEPLFSPAGDLLFLADWSDWWNLQRVPLAALEGPGDPVAEPLHRLAADCCPPAWQFGGRHFACLEDGRVLFSLLRDCLWQLVLLDPANGRQRILHAELGGLDTVFVQGGRARYAAASLDRETALWEVDLEEGEPRLLFAAAGPPAVPPAWRSVPRHLQFSGPEGEPAYALFYPPTAEGVSAPSGSLPPLVVAVHGGPTSSARAGYNPLVQFFTTRGYAYLDVNHRGSSGYGRRYRQSLYGCWGVADLADIVAAVAHLLEQGLVDPERVVIRGGSAGGYAVLAALAESGLFSAGCSYYGISDLALLAADTHKFESRYLDRLIGPWPVCAQRYRERSPLHKLERIQAPVLLLQGLDDKVVPPNQAEALYVRLREIQPASRLILFPGEGHGFRQPANRQRALEAELAFYEAQLWGKNERSGG